MFEGACDLLEIEQPADHILRPQLYVVWVETNLGDGVTDWEINSGPTTLELAEQEAIVCLAMGFLSLVLPEGSTPRPDGLFSNPATDPPA